MARATSRPGSTFSCQLQVNVSDLLEFGPFSVVVRFTVSLRHSSSSALVSVPMPDETCNAGPRNPSISPVQLSSCLAVNF